MNFKLELTEHEANFVLQLLAKMPLGESLDTFLKIKNECEKQLKQQENDTN